MPRKRGGLGGEGGGGGAQRELSGVQKKRRNCGWETSKREGCAEGAMDA